MTDQPTPWPGFKYEPVRGLVDRHIARYLRTQRRNMTRFFMERGRGDLTERMRQIRRSRQGMVVKNQMFQEVLSTYVEQTNHGEVARAQGPADVGSPGPDVDALGAAPEPAAEAAPAQEPERVLGVPPRVPVADNLDGSGGVRGVPGAGLPALENEDGADA